VKAGADPKAVSDELRLSLQALHRACVCKVLENAALLFPDGA